MVDKIFKYFTGGLALIIVIGGALFFIYPNIQRGARLRQQSEELQLKIDRKRAEIAQLAENQRRFGTDPDFIEHIARQNRRVFPGEYLFLFESDKK